MFSEINLNLSKYFIVNFHSYNVKEKWGEKNFVTFDGRGLMPMVCRVSECCWIVTRKIKFGWGGEHEKIINICSSELKWTELRVKMWVVVTFSLLPFQCFARIFPPHRPHHEVAKNVNIWLDFCAASRKDVEFWTYMKITNFLERRKMEWKKFFIHSEHKWKRRIWVKFEERWCENEWRKISSTMRCDVFRESESLKKFESIQMILEIVSFFPLTMRKAELNSSCRIQHE